MIYRFRTENTHMSMFGPCYHGNSTYLSEDNRQKFDQQFLMNILVYDTTFCQRGVLKSPEMALWPLAYID